MQLINYTEPIFADFGNADKDGAIRLITSGTLSDLNRMKISLTEGQKIWLTDNDVEVIATLTLRNNIWVAIPDENGFKSVPKDAWYHNDNLEKK